VNGWQRYWLGFAVGRSKLNLFRVVFFTIVALDCFIDIAHAARYGARGFNVSQLPGLDPVLPVPSRVAIATVCLVGAFLALRMVFGVAMAASVRLLTALWAYRYFISQLDSYQHHYLISLLLLIGCFVPWEEARQRPEPPPRRERKRKKQRDAEPRRHWLSAGIADMPAELVVRHWAIRLLVVQVAILYFWAAVAKMNHAWVDGSALHAEMSTGWASDLVQRVFGAARVDQAHHVLSHGGFAVAAKLVLAAELMLAALLLVRPLWPAALLIGVPFHVFVEASGFRIGLFSYFMVGFYVLMIPDAWLEWLGARWRRGTARMWSAVQARLPSGDGAAAVAVLLTISAAIMVGITPFERVLYAALAILVIGMATVVTRWRAARREGATAAPLLAAGAGNAAAALVVLLLHVFTDQAFDYYKFLSGTARRSGDQELAARCYRRMLDIRPGYSLAHYHLGVLALQDGSESEAIERFQRAQTLDPADSRAFEDEAQIYAAEGDFAHALTVVEACEQRLPREPACAVKKALVLQGMGRHDDALAAARHAVDLDARDPAALRVLRALQGGKARAPSPPPAPEPDGDEDRAGDDDR